MRIGRAREQRRAAKTVTRRLSVVGGRDRKAQAARNKAACLIGEADIDGVREGRRIEKTMERQGLLLEVDQVMLYPGRDRHAHAPLRQRVDDLDPHRPLLGALREPGWEILVHGADDGVIPRTIVVAGGAGATGRVSIRTTRARYGMLSL